MSHAIFYIQDTFNTLRLLISGRYELRDSNIKEFADEVYDVEIPDLSEDRANLKRDRDEAIRAYKKAVDKKKLELELK